MVTINRNNLEIFMVFFKIKDNHIAFFGWVEN